jgi:hypothetical protein
MREYKDMLHFLYGRGFWYADPFLEIKGLTEEQLLWIPTPHSLCILWHVGHIGHREKTHIGIFGKGLKPPIIPPQYEIFGPEWASVDSIKESIDTVDDVFRWVKNVREESHAYISSLNKNDLFRIPQTSDQELSVGHWLLITSAHTALHIGKIQLLKSMLEGKKDRAC